MTIRPGTLALLLFVIMAAGCAPDTQTYSLSLKNDTATPITIALTKDGPPYELAWASPEDIAAGRVSVKPDAPTGFATVTPGQSRGVKNLKGDFNSNTHALLRIYRGNNLQVRDLLPIKPGPNRQDVSLKPGDNRFVVHENQGNLSVETVGN